MRRIEVNINAQPDWKTQYPPEQVGKYLIEHEDFLVKLFGEPGALIDVKPGQMFPTPPEPTLDNFLMWAAEEAKPNQYKEKKR